MMMSVFCKIKKYKPKECIEKKSESNMTRVVILVVIAEKNEYNTTHIWMPQE
jgi:hypothetical protein